MSTKIKVMNSCLQGGWIVRAISRERQTICSSSFLLPNQSVLYSTISSMHAVPKCCLNLPNGSQSKDYDGCLLVCSAIIALMMEASRTSETLVNFYQTTRRYNPEDSHLRTHRRENLKSYLKIK
jgi:hypothetical protein